MCKYCSGTVLLRQAEIRDEHGNPEIHAELMMVKSKHDSTSTIKVIFQNRKTVVGAMEWPVKYCPYCGKKLVPDPIFPEITSDSAAQIFKDPKNGPAIMFWINVENRYLAVDNRDHIYIVNDFDTKEECLKWLSKQV